MIAVLREVLSHYDLPGEITEVTECVSGHINDTYRVTLVGPDGQEKELIVQRINNYVFKDPALVMHNIQVITEHVKAKQGDYDCDIISFFENKDQANYTKVQDQYWRVCQYVPDSVTYDFVENSQVLYSAGYAFGRFQAILSDLPMDRLYETIPDFHNTRQRLEDFFAIAELDPLGRAKEVQEEIAFFREQYDLATRLCDLLEAGEVPLRVTHNDTKYNNILMHEQTLKPLCVIDLDTVMPGLAMHDFGDAIRFAANTAVEDERDLTKVSLNLEHYREFTRGFLGACQGFLTQGEIETMALGAVTITIELASRFLADHIDGDKYFKIHRENHNLDRARCQIKLAQDMLDKYDIMCRIVEECVTGQAATLEAAATRE
ncbi:MAG: aminoglycoside phosphotransferase family protein [Firmicutes bacterium]|nr:aminoglycoside phosphotransferase family protein [Bacillota bacterium]